MENPYIDEETGEKWEFVESKDGICYKCRVNFYRDKDSDQRYTSIFFTEGAEEWLREFLNGWNEVREMDGRG